MPTRSRRCRKAAALASEEWASSSFRVCSILWGDRRIPRPLCQSDGSVLPVPWKSRVLTGPRPGAAAH